MGNRNAKHIQTGRAQLFIDITALEKPGQGSVTITGGSAGTIATLLINGISAIANAVSWETSHAVTAQKLADEINGHISSPDYHARAVGAVCYIWQQTVVAGTITLASTVTGNVTKTDADITGGVVGDGTSLGMVQEGFDLLVNDEYLKEASDDFGVEFVKEFFTGQNVQIQMVCKQWDPDVLATRFQGRFNNASSVERIEFPGTIQAGDDMDPYAKVMALIPDNKAYPTLLIRKGIASGQANVPIRFRTAEIKKLALTIDCMRDFDHTTTDYATMGIALAQNLSL